MSALCFRAAVAALLVASCCVESARLLLPTGDLISGAEKSFSFSFPHEVTVFGEKISAGTKHYVNRLSGRITLGSETYEGTFEPGDERLHHFLHPAEVFSDNRAVVSELRQASGNEEHLNQARDLVHDNFWNSSFSPVGVQLFTWIDQRRSDNSQKRNTFQAAVIYSDSETYAFFNYVNMTYLDTVVGHKVMAGFSKKGSFESAFLPFTGGEAGSLPSVSGVSNRTLGRFIFRIDTWPPRRGGCLTADPTSPADRILSTTVSRDSVLGGSLAIVSGRCPAEGASGSCSITMGDSIIGESAAVNCTDCRNVFLACLVPPSYREGNFSLSLKLDTYGTYSTDFSFGKLSTRSGHAGHRLPLGFSPC